MSTQPANIDQRKSDAVHRALLAGLLGNIGYKKDLNEYNGPRGSTFAIFPGSTLFRKGPKWVMAAEIVQTARLYARTVGPVQPQWIERYAGHLVKRTQFEPHWNRRSAHVMAYEKVMLYGLVLVHRRPVHYGPINPVEAREIFIRHALVEGDYHTPAPFFQHNLGLVNEIRRLEDRLRTRNLLADPQVQYSFYNLRIPEGIHNGPAFDKWRKQTEQENPRLLFMHRQDLLRGEVHDITPENYPDQITVNGLRIPLNYLYDPEDPADGITTQLPLAAINQLPEEPFEWLVPGMLKEKTVALIKSLPKQFRTKLIPAPDTADTVLARLSPSPGTPGEGRGEGPFRRGSKTRAALQPDTPASTTDLQHHQSLYQTLAHELGRIAGEPIPPSAFEPQNLPPYLHMNFRILDDSGRTVAMGRSLPELRRRLGREARSAFESLPESPYNRSNITRWDFGDLPERIEISHRGLTLNAYPALVDERGTVALRLFDSPAAARQAMRAGIRRLFMVQLHREVRDLLRSVPEIESMCLNYATLGACDELKADLVTAAADRALFDSRDNVRTQEQFARLAEQAWRRLTEAGREIFPIVAQSLDLRQSLTLQLQKRYPPPWMPALNDMANQLSRLVYKGFVVRTPQQWLIHLPRYLRGIVLRLRKLTDGAFRRDQQMAQMVQPLWQRYLDHLHHHPEPRTHDPELELYRWMIEELRISLFAQELKTAVPVSVQKLEQQWAKVRQ